MCWVRGSRFSILGFRVQWQSLLPLSIYNYYLCSLPALAPDPILNVQWCATNFLMVQFGVLCLKFRRMAISSGGGGNSSRWKRVAAPGSSGIIFFPARYRYVHKVFANNYGRLADDQPTKRAASNVTGRKARRDPSWRTFDICGFSLIQWCYFRTAVWLPGEL